MLIRTLLPAALLCLLNFPLLAADCPIPAYTPRTSDQITDWYEKYIVPSIGVAASPATSRPTKDQIEASVERLEAFHRRRIGDPLFFESIAQQISSHYTRARDFRGLNTSAAQKIYQGGSDASLDFTALCIDSRSSRAPDDTFAITLFGVNNDICRHATLRGLVFTSTLINGAVDGECRPDHIYYKRLIIPVTAGTNTITFVCGKDANGCERR